MGSATVIPVSTQRTPSRARVLAPAGMAVAAALALAACTSGKSDAEQTAAARATIDKYCTDCHNDAERTGDLSLERVKLDDVPNHAEMWEQVALKLRGRMMPPA